MSHTPQRRFNLGPAAALLAATLVSLQVSAQAQAPVTVDDVLAYLHEHRADVAVASFTASANGWLEPEDPVLVQAPLQPMPLGSTIKIVTLAAYAREVEAGRLDPRRPVRLDAWERYYLPGSDGEAHPRSLAELGLAFDELGFALEPDREVPLSALVDAMMRHSDNAAADYLLELLGPAAVRTTIRLAGLVGQQQPVNLLGFLLVAHNHEDGALTAERLHALQALPRARFLELCREYAARYGDPSWRVADLAWQLATPAPSYELRVAAEEALAPRGIVFDYALLLARLAAGRFLSPAISARMLSHLAISVDPDDPAIAALAGKGGTLDGVLTYALLVVPKVGPFAGKPRVSVVFLRNMPEDLHAAFDAENVPFLLSALLGLDPAVVEQVRAALRG